jgi:hypothetical protein
MTATDQKPVYYEKIELIPADDWRDIDFVRARNAPPEPDAMRDLRIDLQGTCRVVAGFFKSNRARKHHYLRKLHQVADTGMRGVDFTIEGAKTDLVGVKQEVVDEAYETRSAILATHSRLSAWVFVLTFIPGLVLYYASLKNYMVPGRTAEGIFPGEIVLLVALFWIPAGAAVGTWSEFALRTQTISFDGLLNFDPARWSPVERLRVTIVISFVLAFLLGTGMIQVGLGSILLNDFASTKPYCSLAIGFITGFAFPYVRDIIYRVQPVTK